MFVSDGKQPGTIDYGNVGLFPGRSKGDDQFEHHCYGRKTDFKNGGSTGISTGSECFAGSVGDGGLYRKRK